jgi:PEP-CTERM motif-containing protein
MMRAARFIAILWVVFLASGVSVVRAGVITAITTPAGPGCNTTGCTNNTSSFTTLAPNNDDIATSPSTNTFALLENFTAFDSINVTFTVADSAGLSLPPGQTLGTTVTEYFGSNISVMNNTGVAWSAFHWSLIPAVSTDGLDFDALSQLPAPTASSGRFTSLAHGVDTIDWSGGTGVGITQTVIFKFSIDVPDGITSFTLQGRPDVNGVVPEPASLMLLGSGLAGLGLWRRRHA